jgi:hypothetical protein
MFLCAIIMRRLDHLLHHHSNIALLFRPLDIRPNMTPYARPCYYLLKFRLIVVPTDFHASLRIVSVLSIPNSTRGKFE